MNTLAHLPPDIAYQRVLGLKDTAAFFGITTSQLQRMTRQGIGPEPLRFSARRYGWRIRDLIEYLDCVALTGCGGKCRDFSDRQFSLGGGWEMMESAQ